MSSCCNRGKGLARCRDTWNTDQVLLDTGLNNVWVGVGGYDELAASTADVCDLLGGQHRARAD